MGVVSRRVFLVFSFFGVHPHLSQSSGGGKPSCSSGLIGRVSGDSLGLPCSPGSFGSSFFGVVEVLAPVAARDLCPALLDENRTDFEAVEILGFWRPSQSYPAYLDSRS
jgi:hypothetical protein